MSLFGEYPCQTTPIPPSYISFTSASVTAILALVTIPGNILVLLAISLDPNKDLKSPFNSFVVSLASADLIVGLVLDPVGSAYLYSEGISGAYPASLNYIFVPYFIVSTASVLSLAALTMDRYIAITSPLTYRLTLNPKRAGFVAAGIWIVSVSFTLLYIGTGYLTYAFVFANTVVVLTFLVMIYTYVKIFRSIRQQEVLNSADADNAARRRLQWEQRVTKSFLIMLAFFLGCYLPSCVCIYITNLCSVCSCVFIHWARDVHFVLIMANSAANPFVYAWRFQNVRAACVKILRRRCCCRPPRVAPEPEGLGVTLATVSTST